jgi:hypothetical protein
MYAFFKTQRLTLVLEDSININHKNNRLFDIYSLTGIKSFQIIEK